ncbi:MAG: HipA domain-containing protein [Bacteroidetes bacterium]|nr:HipA domain-containing protein [Bacteroidota bacterium]MDA1122248.1 HipA domain-containing protein [Bacteroidota bacterium]
MSFPEIRFCPGTLTEGFTGYSRTCLKRVFNGKKVSHVLPYNPSQISEDDSEKFLENRKRISISGVQEKLSFILEKNVLRLTKKGEQGTYILKPIPRDLKHVDQVPANEHLTMQIARQVYGIQTAENALIFFKNGDPAYITKRFDVLDQGDPSTDRTSKLGIEDFATLAGKTTENTGVDFKYNYSYEQLAALFTIYVPAYRVELEKLFSLIVFNYLFSNGDAHLKNFSVIESPEGDYILSPAYDLINTRIHVDDTDFALTEGLFQDDFESKQMKNNGRVGLDDFNEFARRIGISEKRRDKVLFNFLEKQDAVEILIHRSFLNQSTKHMYLLHYQTKRNQLNAR